MSIYIYIYIYMEDDANILAAHLMKAERERLPVQASLVIHAK